MPIVQQGSINTTALVVPDLYVQIVPPQNLVINGVPTNRVGVVGTANWGPVNQPVICATMADYARQFGPIQNRKYDMGTAVACAVQQGAQDFRCVRVTDGTDAGATQTLGDLQIFALYTGSFGNGITLALATGTKPSTFRLTVTAPGLFPEVFDNIPLGTGGGAAAAFWTALGNAINVGIGPLRGPSQIVYAGLLPNGTHPTPTAVTESLTGGTDGTATITAATLVGVDTTPRSGMYALRGQGCSIGVLADADDPTQWTTQASFGLSEGLYMMAVAPAGSPILGSSGVVTLKQTAGLDSYAVKLLHGDWLYWNDPVNQVVRLVSPQGFVAGRLANLSPEQSSLNKQLYSVIGSQKSGVVGSGQTTTYSDAELTALFQAGVDVVSNPQPGGYYWGVRCGHNSSSNAAENGDNYTRLTNYIAATLNAAMGLFVGKVINSGLFRQIGSTLLSFCQNLLQQGILGTTDGSLPFSVICDTSNNPFSRTSLNYVQADVQIRYQGINEKFIVNIEGGETVVVTKQTTPAGQQ